MAACARCLKIGAVRTGIRRRFPTYGGYFSSSGKFKPIDASWTTLPDLRLRLWQLSERLAEIR